MMKPFMKTKRNFSFFKKIKKDEKGVMAIEIVIGTFITLLIVAFLLDVLQIGWKFTAISQTNTYIARTVGIQGGLLKQAPTGFQGGDKQYISTKEMKEQIDRKMASAGIDANNYKVYINGVPITQEVAVDYGQPITTRMEVKYKWVFFSNLSPGNQYSEVASERQGLSEFKYRYDGWDKEE